MDLVMLHGLENVGDMGAVFRRRAAQRGRRFRNSQSGKIRPMPSTATFSPVMTAPSSTMPIRTVLPVEQPLPLPIQEEPPLPPAYVPPKKYFQNTTRATMALEGLGEAENYVERYANAIRLEHPSFNAHPEFVRALVRYGLSNGLIQKYGVRFMDKMPIDALKNFVVQYAVELGKVFQMEAAGLDGLGFLPAIAPAAAAVAGIAGKAGALFSTVGGAIGSAASSVWGAVSGIFGNRSRLSSGDAAGLQEVYRNSKVFFTSDSKDGGKSSGANYEAAEGWTNFEGDWGSKISSYWVDTEDIVLIKVFKDYNLQGESKEISPNRNYDGSELERDGWNDTIKSAIVLRKPSVSKLRLPFPNDVGVPPGWNETAYLSANPDVAQQVQSGQYPSGYWHYLFIGMKTGRALGNTSATAAPAAVVNPSTFATGAVATSAPLNYSQAGNQTPPPAPVPVDPLAAIDKLIAKTGNLAASIQTGIKQVEKVVNAPTSRTGSDGIPVVQYGGGEIEVTAERPRAMQAGFSSNTLLLAGGAAVLAALVLSKKK